VSLHATGARAHVGAEGASTSAALSDLHVLGVPGLDALPFAVPGLVDVAGITATTRQRIVDGALVVEAKATLSGLSLAGGLLRIGSVVSTSSLRAGTTGPADTSTGVKISDVSLAGAPVELGEAGLAGLGDALRQLGIHVELLPSERRVDDGVAIANSGGIVVELATPLTGLPPLPGPLGDLDINGSYGLRVQIGTTGVRGYAAGFDDVGDATGDDEGFVETPPLLGDGGASFPGLPNPPLANRPAGGRTTAPGRGGLLSHDLADRMGLIYLAFTLGAVALCLSPRLLVPARLPGTPR
jgi:hypothetical protein